MVEGKNNKQKNRTKYFLPGGKKQIQAVCAFLFLGVLILSCGVNLMHKDRQMSEKEMRMLAQKPEISLSGIASGRFMEQYEEYVSDQFAGRDTWVRIKTFADSVAGRTEEGGVFKGKDHYLMEDVAVADESDLKENLELVCAVDHRRLGEPRWDRLDLAADNDKIEHIDKYRQQQR